MDYSEKWGKNVEDAVELALQDLKVDKDQVEITVLEEPSRGFFGIGSRLAKVRVTVKRIEKEKILVEEKEKEVRVEKPLKDQVEEQEDLEVKREKPARRHKSKRKDSRGYKKENIPIRERPDDLVEIEESFVLEFLEDLIVKMGLSVEVKGFENEDNLFFDVRGSDAGTLIGKRGQTLDAIQYLVSLVANKNREKYVRVTLDAENYRAKRERTLEQLANRLGNKVQKTGKNIRLEPMNPYERKVIHATLQRNPNIKTRSEGEEPYRRVIIEKR